VAGIGLVQAVDLQDLDGAAGVDTKLDRRLRIARRVRVLDRHGRMIAAHEIRLHIHAGVVANLAAGGIVAVAGVRTAEGIELHAGTSGQQHSAGKGRARNEDPGKTRHGAPIRTISI
jgi:hypothetical protein